MQFYLAYIIKIVDYKSETDLSSSKLTIPKIELSQIDECEDFSCTDASIRKIFGNKLACSVQGPTFKEFKQNEFGLQFVTQSAKSQKRGPLLYEIKPTPHNETIIELQSSVHCLQQAKSKKVGSKRYSNNLTR